jgi:glycosyltransferase involved in cell wall biosynthesis
MAIRQPSDTREPLTNALSPHRQPTLEPDRPPECNTPTCSVVICTRDRPLHLDRCLAAMRCQQYPRFTVLVVDNAPRDDAGRAVAERHGVDYLVETEPGLSRARNTGARASDSQIVAFIDDDAIPDPDWLAALAHEFADPVVVAVTGRVEAPSPELERLGTAFGGANRWAVDRSTPHWFEYASLGAVGYGTNMALRRTAFNSWPGFDTRLGRGRPIDGGEEQYAFASLIDRGFRVVYTPAAVVRHPYGRTEADQRQRLLKDYAVSAAYLLFLFVEQPRYRHAIARHLYRLLLGIPQGWRSEATVRPPHISIPRWRIQLARVSGLALYGRVRLRGQWTRERP